MAQYENKLNAQLAGLVFDCDDPEKLAMFYAQLLGGDLLVDPFGGCSVKAPSLPFGLGFQFDQDYTRPVWPGDKGDQLQMIHLDIQVDDRLKAQEFALSLGATMPEEQFCQPEWPSQWVTMLDPAGHPFCLFQEEE